MGHHGPVGAAVLALLFLDLECPCLCSASVTLEQRSLESLLWLFLPCFGPAWSPGQAELVSVTPGRRNGEIHLYHPAHQGRQGWRAADSKWRKHAENWAKRGR